MLKNFNEFLEKVNIMRRQEDAEHIQELQQYMQEIGLADMFNSMSEEEKLNFYYSELNFDNNLLVADREFINTNIAKQANFLCTLDKEWKENFSKICKDEEYFYLYKYRKLLLKKVKIKITPKDLKNALISENYMELKDMLQELFLQSLEFEDLKPLVELIDSAGLDIVDKLFKIHIENRDAYFTEVIDYLKSKDRVCDLYTVVTLRETVDNKKRETIHFTAEEFLDNKELEHRKTSLNELVLSGIAGEDIGTNIVKTEDGIAYFVARNLYVNNEDFQAESNYMWVLV